MCDVSVSVSVSVSVICYIYIYVLLYPSFGIVLIIFHARNDNPEKDVTLGAVNVEREIIG